MGGLADSAPGGRLVALIALRDRLAGDIDVCESARDVAALSQRYMDVLEQIDALEKLQPAKKGTGLDELERRRAERQAPGPKGASVK